VLLLRALRYVMQALFGVTRIVQAHAVAPLLSDPPSEVCAVVS
jgi:hypothetical protein